MRDVNFRKECSRIIFKDKNISPHVIYMGFWFAYWRIVGFLSGTQEHTNTVWCVLQYERFAQVMVERTKELEALTFHFVMLDQRDLGVIAGMVEVILETSTHYSEWAFLFRNIQAYIYTLYGLKGNFFMRRIRLLEHSVRIDFTLLRPGVSSWCNGSHYYVYFRTNTLGKHMNPLILPAMG